MRKFLLGLLALTLLGGLSSTVSLAQDRGGQGGGPGGGGRNWDPAQMQQRMMDAFKERMGATDEEWGVIQPKLAKVLEAQRDARGGGMGGMMGGRGNRGGDRGNRGGEDAQDQSPTAKAASDLRTTLENEKSSPDEIKAKLKTVRDTRAAAQKDLKAAQEDLKGVLTERQEAMLVLVGMMD